MKSSDECVFIYAIVKKEDYDKVKLPQGASFAKALEIGPASELCNMESCRGWGAMAGIALAKLGLKLFPEVHKIMNPDKSPLDLNAQ